LILNYFGENTITDCGSCSYCITKKVKKEDDNGLSYEILTLLKSEDLNSREIQFKTKKTTDEIIFALQQLLENEQNSHKIQQQIYLTIIMEKLRIVFMGTPEFAVGILDSIIKNNYEVVGVITAADKPAGRGQKIKYSAVKEYALEII
jgi:hypothetical protein